MWVRVYGQCKPECQYDPWYGGQWTAVGLSYVVSVRIWVRVRV